jgi:hypothetical protein
MAAILLRGKTDCYANLHTAQKANSNRKGLPKIDRPFIFNKQFVIAYYFLHLPLQEHGFFTAAWAAARRAIGTLNGEQDT